MRKTDKQHTHRPYRQTLQSFVCVLLLGASLPVLAAETVTTTPVPATRPAVLTPLPATSTGLPRAALALDAQTRLHLVRLPAGSFAMGSPDSEKGHRRDEEPVHQVTLDAFWIGEFEVTNAQFRAFLRQSDYQGEADARSFYLWHFRDRSRVSDEDRYPVVFVSWHNAVAFCTWLSGKTGLQVRLPTEAEWEYACRAGTTTRFSFGDELTELEHFAWYKHNAGGKTHPVGQKRPNPWGLYDMHGNAQEWCLDYYQRGYENAPSDGAPVEQDNDFRVFRDCGWYYLSRECRCAQRGAMRPRSANNNVGFRVVVSD